jgi:O-antigen biosynthesis protein
MLSICLASLDGRKWLEPCLKSVQDSLVGVNHEILVADDASQDDTLAWLEQVHPEVRVFAGGKRRGFAWNNNWLAREARGEVLCFLNNDTVVTGGWWEPMRAAIESVKSVGCVGNVQWSPRTRHYDHMGITFSPEGEPFHFGKRFGWRPFRGVTEWGAVTAACCAIKQEVFLEVGGFDEDYRNGSEDVDLCVRLAQKGYRHYVANESVIKHWVGASVGRGDFNTENQALFLKRWGEQMRETWGVTDQRIYAFNYLWRHASQPWRYNEKKLRRALGYLAKSDLKARSWKEMSQK